MTSVLVIVLAWLLLGALVSTVLGRAIRTADVLDEQLARLSRPPESTDAATLVTDIRSARPPVAAPHRSAVGRAPGHRRRRGPFDEPTP